MSKTVLTRLGFSNQEKARLRGLTGSIKDISEYLSDVVELSKDLGVAEALKRAAPWFGIVGDAAGKALPLIKFATELLKGFTTEHDPEALGHLACTLAYQRAIEETVNSIEVPIVSNKEMKSLKKELEAREPSVNTDFMTFSYDNALIHEFVINADEVVQAYATAVGYDQPQTLALVNGIHEKFVPILKRILSDGQTKDSLEPFRRLVEIGTKERQAYLALRKHARYQKWLFEKAPVLKKEPYSLADIYIDTECGSLTWDEIKKEIKKNQSPFSAQVGDRVRLLETVMDLIADATFRDAIVIQGGPGAGKSSLTVKLCCELLRQGLKPIRIELIDVGLNKDATTSLPAAVRLGEHDLFPTSAEFAPDGLFLGDRIFDEKVPFRGTFICPYVLILDGWNEIRGPEGFRADVAKLLYQVRQTYLKNRSVPVRLILTGRPSRDVNESKLFTGKTRVLTIRPLKPTDLENLIKALTQALQTRPIQVDNEGGRWSMPNLNTFKPILSTYEKDFERRVVAGTESAIASVSETASSSGSLEILGSPLLAHLAIRLISQRPRDRKELLSSPTSLYRSLVDLTIQQSGKAPEDSRDEDTQAGLAGTELRALFRRVAAVTTALGGKTISYSELQLRLNGHDLLDRMTAEAAKENVLSTLMISFYFRDTELGAEFEHPSFREYLFAEAIVEILKQYGATEKPDLSERAVYWKDFAEDDARFTFARELSECLAPQWLSPDVVRHIEQLLKWEIGRANGDGVESTPGNPTIPLTLEGWCRVRDGLADVWDWWAEGVHLRPQPVKDRESGVYDLSNPPFVQDLIAIAIARDLQQRRLPQSPNRTVTMDAHLGDGLIRLCALVHYLVAVKSGWLNSPDSDGPPERQSATGRAPSALWNGVSPIGKGPRKWQSEVQQGDRRWVFFAPCGQDTNYFGNYTHRINAAGWRPFGPFPLGVNLSGIDLRKAAISIPYYHDDDIEDPFTTTWIHANLSDTRAAASYFYANDFTGVLAKSAKLDLSFFLRASFQRADLEAAELRGSACFMTSFEEANLTKAILERTDLRSARFDYANLEETDFAEARLGEDTSFYGSNVQDARKNLNELLAPFDED